MSSRKVFGLNVSNLRTKLCLTQEQLCERADIDRSYLQRIENGSSSPTVEVAARLKRSLQCSWEVLFDGVK